MNNNQSPFYVGQKVVCIEKDPYARSNGTRNEKIFINQVYVVSETGLSSIDGKEERIRVNDLKTRWYPSSFAPYNPYTESVSKQLAEQAMQDKVEVDVVKVKQPICN